MNTPLPPILTAYFTAANALRVDETSACFAPDAIVHDEGRTYADPAAIHGWIEETVRKYGARVEVRAVQQAEGKVIVTGLVSGNFPGSPAELDYEFTLRDGLITGFKVL